MHYSERKTKHVVIGMVTAIANGRPVHVRVLTGHIHEDTLQANHSLVMDSFDITEGSKKNPKVVRFGFKDPDGGHTGTLVWESSGRFESEPKGKLEWRYDDDKEWWNYCGENPPPWRYQVMTVSYQ